MPGTALSDAEALQRTCQLLLRELTIGLERALMAFKDPKSAAEPFRRRLEAAEREGDRIARVSPHFRTYTRSLIADTKKQFGEWVARAVRANEQRGHVDGRFQGEYNKVVGQALSDLPHQATSALKSQIDSRIGDVIDLVFPDGKIPSDVRSVMQRELGRWIGEQPVVEDAFFLAQKVLVDVAGFMHQRLTIHAEIKSLRDSVARSGKLSPADAAAADSRAGQLAKAANDLDAKIERAVTQTGMSVQGIVKLNPKLVLDPTRRFLSSLDAQAGIRIRKDQVTVELGTKLSITNPLMLDGTTGVNVNPYLGVNVGPNFQLGAQYQTTYQGGSWKGNEFKATLTWRF